MRLFSHVLHKGPKVFPVHKPRENLSRFWCPLKAQAHRTAAGETAIDEGFSPRHYHVLDEDVNGPSGLFLFFEEKGTGPVHAEKSQVLSVFNDVSKA